MPREGAAAATCAASPAGWDTRTAGARARKHPTLPHVLRSCANNKVNLGTTEPAAGQCCSDQSTKYGANFLCGSCSQNGATCSSSSACTTACCGSTVVQDQTTFQRYCV